VHNGDFETGVLGGWQCTGSQCNVVASEDGGHHLQVEARGSEFSGPWQLLDPLPGSDQLNLNLRFSIKASRDSLAKWKVRVTKVGDIKYFSLSQDAINTEDWISVSHDVTLSSWAVGASEIKLYLEVSPNSDFNIDNVWLEEVDNGGGDWEEEAALRIDTLRKRDLKMEVVMPEGTSYDQLKLEVTQVGHGFPFGTAVKSPRIAACWDAGNGTQPVNDAYCNFVEENYNWVVDTYRMKWKPMEPNEGQWDTEIPDKMLQWVARAPHPGIQVRGHALFWSKRWNNPGWVQDLYGDDLVSAMINRVNFTVNHFHQDCMEESFGCRNVAHWDVINEMVNQGSESHEFYMEHTGDPLIRSKMFKLAKSISPDTLLFLNDYGIIMNKHGRFELFQQQIRDLLDQGTPIDALGLQSHFKGTEVVDVVKIKRHVDLLWEEFNLPIWVTEFDWNANNDVDMGDHSLHAEQIHNFYTLMFSLEAVHGVISWNMNIVDEVTTEPNKAGQEYLRLTKEEWSSSQLLSPTAGLDLATFNFRGFKGYYSFRFLLDGEQYGDGMNVTIKEDTVLRCDFNDGFDVEACSGL